MVATLLSVYVSSAQTLPVRDTILFEARGYTPDASIQRRVSERLGLPASCLMVTRDPRVSFRVSVQPPPYPLTVVEDMMLPTFRSQEKYAGKSLDIRNCASGGGTKEGGGKRIPSCLVRAHAYPCRFTKYGTEDFLLNHILELGSKAVKSPLAPGHFLHHMRRFVCLCPDRPRLERIVRDSIRCW